MSNERRLYITTAIAYANGDPHLGHALDVFHVHLHVFPRFEGDGFGLRLPPDYDVRPRAELDAAASALRQAWPAR